MQPRSSWIGLGLTALCLCGCNQGSPNAAAPQRTDAVEEPAQFSNLPAGAPCTEKIRRFQWVLAADVATGNLERPVYDQIETELGKAADACIGGQGREAIALVKASQERHGYHV